MQRILRGAPATITVTFVDQNGEPTEATGDVTIGVTRADGTVLVAPDTATDAGDDTGVYTFNLDASDTAQLDMLTARWTDDNSTIDDQVAIVGGYYARLAEIRASHKTLASPSDVSDERLLAARDLAELECERCCGRSFVPNYNRVRVSGDGTAELYLPNTSISVVRSVRVYTSPTTYSTFTDAQLAALVLNEDGRVVRPFGDVWDSGLANLIIEIEHGELGPPVDIKDAVMRRIRHWVSRREAAIPSRATSWSAPADAGGGTYQLDTAGKFKTGDPEVDAVYIRNSFVAGDGGDGDGGSANAPISRPIDFDPQYDSIFHGGRQ